MNALKKRCLHIKPGSGLYTAMEFHTYVCAFVTTEHMDNTCVHNNTHVKFRYCSSYRTLDICSFLVISNEKKMQMRDLNCAFGEKCFSQTVRNQRWWKMSFWQSEISIIFKLLKMSFWQSEISIIFKLLKMSLWQSEISFLKNVLQLTRFYP